MVECGEVIDWYMIYFGYFVLLGVGLLCIEVIVVEFDGCIMYGDFGLWDDVIEVVLKLVFVVICKYLLVCIVM